jgi:Leucine-rich repeat (LRR) protein
LNNRNATAAVIVPLANVPLANVSLAALLSVVGLAIAIVGCGRSVSPPPQASPSGGGADVGTSSIAATSDEIEVDLRDAVVTQDQVDRIASNRSLRRLRLAGSNVDDAAIAKFATLPKLELFDLVNCQSLTPAALVSIGQIRSLRNLRLSGNSVTDRSVQNLSSLKQLAAILLQNTAVTDSGVAVLGDLSELKDINLYGTAVTDASYDVFKRLPKLEKLVLRGTAITGESAASLSQLAMVKELDLSETAFGSVGLPAVAAMPQLTKVTLWLTKVDDMGLGQFKGNSRLLSLNLDNVSSITDASIDTIATLTSLQYLHLGGTSVTAAGIEKLAPLAKLETLIATRLGLTMENGESIRVTLPSLVRLDID